MNLGKATALITGANRGIGRHLAAQLVTRGAKVYATARRPESINIYGVEVLPLDVTDPDAVTDAAEKADDVNLLVNNAGIGGAALLGDIDDVRAAMDVNFWGTLSMVRAFAPVLARNGGGAVLNIASSASWFVLPGGSAQGPSKAAVWSMSDELRRELAGQRTLVTSVHLGAAGTATTKGSHVPGTAPADVAHAALDGIEADAFEVVVDEFTVMANRGRARTPWSLRHRPWRRGAVRQ
ncbi:SDR family NAD(P)-dependent oxidoreductase [Streptomyces shenzhenensis]|uniref:SDR family NAD(P)-dependent oxidoreductase n=1 Tax=Streptomyces shenzhenensis TaxID=943815 RepID=UPI00381458A7